jgi:16S rRNA (guanine(966)-N(2))-methyltransferase RsmD
MRVIAGKFGGTALRGGHGPQFRPTAQIVKGSIFDTLYGQVQGASFLDLFAGSGSMGIEALSRGASRAVFVEQDQKILRALRTNLDRCGASDRAEIVRGDAMKYLDRLIRSGEAFDIIFADPPYASNLSQRIAITLGSEERKVCDLLITESGKEYESGEKGSMKKIRTRKFGQTIITYLEYSRTGQENPGAEGQE